MLGLFPVDDNEVRNGVDDSSSLSAALAPPSTAFTNNSSSTTRDTERTTTLSSASLSEINPSRSNIMDDIENNNIDNNLVVEGAAFTSTRTAHERKRKQDHRYQKGKKSCFMGGIALLLLMTLIISINIAVVLSKGNKNMNTPDLKLEFPTDAGGFHGGHDTAVAPPKIPSLPDTQNNETKNETFIALLNETTDHEEEEKEKESTKKN